MGEASSKCPICGVDTPHSHTEHEQEVAHVLNVRNVRAGAFGAAIGRRNQEAVRDYFSTHLCATNAECGAALGLSGRAVTKHVKTIRAEWLP